MTDIATEQEKQAMVTSLRLLAATPKSRKALEEKLKERGYAIEIVEKVLGKLERQGILNDSSFAQSVMQTLLIHRPSGRKRISYELKKRGIGQALVEQLMEKYPAREEREKAIELASNKWDRWENLEKAKRRKKLYDFLVRRGFDFALSREAVEWVERDRAA